MLVKKCLKTVLLAVVLPLWLFSAPGCGNDRAEDEKRILAFDPSFKEDLEKRDMLRKELVNKKADLAKFRREVAFKIRELKQQEVKAKRLYEASIEKVRLQINPYQRRLKQDLYDKQRLYKSKKAELSDIEKDIEEIAALMDKKDRLVLTQEEVRTWNDRLSILAERKAQLNAEIEDLEKDIEIMKLKIKVMRL
ncbi:MAG: hypothetical protein GF408_05400 [Candidatus Omnitrophica bacterium]|nr:hypothetical protein [Candidatus Omnitrophota bacterium]